MTRKSKLDEFFWRRAAVPSIRGHGTHRECFGHLFRLPANDLRITGFDDVINLLFRPVEGNHFRDNMTHKARAMSTHAGTTYDILRFRSRRRGRRLFLLWATPAPTPRRWGPIARAKVVGVARRLRAFLRVAHPEGIL